MLFVYGTLKRGHCRSSLLSSQKFISNIKTESNYKIFNCGGFPGLVSNQEGCVEGELWEVSEDYIEYLDHVEGSPYLYKLEPVKVSSVVPVDNVFSYFWQKSIVGLDDCGPIWTTEGER